MKKKVLIIILFICSTSILKAQEKVTEEQRALYAKILFANKDAIFDNNTYQYQVEKFDEKKFNNRTSIIEKIKLTKENIGETFKLGGCDFKLVDVKNNILVIDNLCDNKVDFEIINLTKEGDEVKPYSFFELLDMEEEDENINVDSVFGLSKIQLSKKIYEIFENSPEITKEEFDKIVTIEMLESLEESKKYEIIKSVAKFEGAFIFYLL